MRSSVWWEGSEKPCWGWWKAEKMPVNLTLHIIKFCLNADVVECGWWRDIGYVSLSSSYFFLSGDPLEPWPKFRINIIVEGVRVRVHVVTSGFNTQARFSLRTHSISCSLLPPHPVRSRVQLWLSSWNWASDDDNDVVACPEDQCNYLIIFVLYARARCCRHPWLGELPGLRER